jgi:hypothetical protein
MKTTGHAKPVYINIGAQNKEAGRYIHKPNLHYKSDI